MRLQVVGVCRAARSISIAESPAPLLKIPRITNGFLLNASSLGPKARMKQLQKRCSNYSILYLLVLTWLLLDTASKARSGFSRKSRTFKALQPLLSIVWQGHLSPKYWDNVRKSPEGLYTSSVHTLPCPMWV